MKYIDRITTWHQNEKNNIIESKSELIKLPNEELVSSFFFLLLHRNTHKESSVTLSLVSYITKKTNQIKSNILQFEDSLLYFFFLLVGQVVTRVSYSLSMSKLLINDLGNIA